jgi:4-hydroxy-2-oxoheptanedioate aldolase
MSQANEQRMVAVQIEDPEALEELDGIAQVPGIDMLFFGPGDFSQGIGAPGKMDDARVIDARLRVAEAARRYNKFAGTVAAPETIAERVAEGYSFISVGADVCGIAEYFQKILRHFDDAIESSRAKAAAPAPAVEVSIHASLAKVPQDAARSAL